LTADLSKNVFVCPRVKGTVVSNVTGQIEDALSNMGWGQYLETDQKSGMFILSLILVPFSWWLEETVVAFRQIRKLSPTSQLFEV
jgi:hypothetical protein